MLNRNAAGVILGFAALCLVIAAYSVGRMNGLEAGLRAQATPAAIDATTTPPAVVGELSPSPRAPQNIALADAEVIGKALMVYAQDYDETFPPAGNLLKTRERLQPYTRNEEPLIARGQDVGPFYYTFDSKSFASLASPAEQSVGYKDGPGGRAFVFADGHTSWEPRNAPTATPAAP